MPKDLKKLYKVTRMKWGDLESLLQAQFKDLRLTSNRSICFVRALPSEEEELIAWCARRKCDLFKKLETWHQIFPEVV